MARKAIARMVCCCVVLMLACGTLVAQSHKLERAHPTTPSKVITPAGDIDAALKVIFTNLGPTKTNYYNITAGGYYVTGPTNTVGASEQAIALPFTPKGNSHVTQLQAAIGYISGTSLVNLALYSDASGVVGTLLAQGTSTKIPTSGACCQVVSVNIPSTAVTAGTQYWIVASSDDVNGPDLASVWQPTNTANTGGNVALGGWFTFSNLLPAGAAAGTVP